MISQLGSIYKNFNLKIFFIKLYMTYNMKLHFTIK